MQRLPMAVRPYPPAALFGLAQEGYGSPFEQLLACIISIRTYDEVTLTCARRLLSAARTQEQGLSFSAAQIDALISPCTFHEAKAHQMREIAASVVERCVGELPRAFDLLTPLRGGGLYFEAPLPEAFRGFV